MYGRDAFGCESVDSNTIAINSDAAAKAEFDGAYASRSVNF